MTTTPSISLPPGERTTWLLRNEAWLRLLARHEVNARYASKFDPSDVVQQTLFEAWQGWERLEARDEAQRLAWLRQILAHQLAHHVRHFGGDAEARRRSRDFPAAATRPIRRASRRAPASA